MQTGMGMLQEVADEAVCHVWFKHDNICPLFQEAAVVFSSNGCRIVELVFRPHLILSDRLWTFMTLPLALRATLVANR